MKYIIDNVMKAEEDRFVKKAFLVTDDKVSYFSDRMPRLKYMRLNMSGFLLTPGHIIVDSQLLEMDSYCNYKEEMKTLVKNGCTTVIVCCKNDTEKDLKADIKRARHKMINSPIDYVLSLSVSLRNLTPNLIRICKKERIPIIFVSFSELEEIDLVQWERIREAMFPLQILIIPQYEEHSSLNENPKKVYNYWKVIMNRQRISTTLSFPEDYVPLSKLLMKMIGLYPRKGELLVGSDIDYLLYHDSSVDHFENFRYDRGNPTLVVLRGVVLKAGEQVFIRPGFGKEIQIKVPGHFVPISEAHYYGVDS
ncbi:hypothetical protein ACJ2A9_10125 [Anaerobacillus sp. MEB173]|uniref:hypothetical protein n=1 Tax=Anaerobacillus sp. MEB173 TaxID=3383345 RepID=UPI003F8F4BD7